MTSSVHTKRMNPRQRSTPNGVTVRRILSRGPDPAPSGGRAEPRRKPLSPSPAPEPLGRRTLDVRASIMLAPIIISNLKMSTLFFRAPRDFSAAGRPPRRFRTVNRVHPRWISGPLCAVLPALAGPASAPSGKTPILGKRFDFIRGHATIRKYAPRGGVPMKSEAPGRRKG